jgi:hypothetical protein
VIHDAAIPPGLEPAHSTGERSGVIYSCADWTPQDLQSLAEHLKTAGRDALVRIDSEELLDGWFETVSAFLDPGSAERQALEPSLARLCNLSPTGLAAGLEAVFGGVTGQAAKQLQLEADSWRTQHEDGSLVLVTLAANLPGLAVQPLLPALLLRRPVILKSPSAEPLLAPAFVRALWERLPMLRSSLAAITWKGGDLALEKPLLEAADRVLAYGETAALADLDERAPDKVFAYGPKTSLAVLDASVEPQSVVEGLARDIALFDQRGCLSIQAIYTQGDRASLADLLANALIRQAKEWPQGRLDPVAAAGVQQIRSEASLRGLIVPDTPLGVGTVVVEPQIDFRPSPGLRTVRIHPIEDLGKLPEILMDWSGQLQGAALAGDLAWGLRSKMEELGISHFAKPGHLQTPDATWHNGGVHPLVALTGDETASI